MDAYKRIVRGDSDINWAVYKYNSSLTDLELYKSGRKYFVDMKIVLPRGRTYDAHSSMILCSWNALGHRGNMG